jgi:hypothetical protein
MDAREVTLYAIVFLGALLIAFQVITVRFTLIRVERKVNLILDHLGIDPMKAPPLSDRVKEIARDPNRTIEAVKALREESGLGLAEALAAVKAYRQSLDDNP